MAGELYVSQKNTMKLIATAVIILLLSGVMNAAEEKEIVLKDGSLVGMHKKYSPASFDLRGLSLTIKDKKLVFPMGLRSLLMYQPDGDPFGEPSDAEWKPYPYTYKFYVLPEELYSKDELPPSILIIIRSTKKHAHYSLLIDMETLEFIRADLVVRDFGRVPIDLDGVPDKPRKKSG
ncbi:hypothetical protein HW115_18940 [Verrucomicrobiaceae bacterium N1E253]|uniref:Uncharacterized protein n=1 Tax=Oceaniferula marina TaxID=2748318 RepID=A0A851GKX4_9BACT|nr:hypothetical protein [Oceaniferula marina]NWK57702.1 hypothetical protein [Oceaniferula marina]